MGSRIEEEKELGADMEKGLATDPVSSAGSTVADLSPTPTPRKTLVLSNSGKALMVSNSSKSLGLSNSGKRFDPTGKKKYVKQVNGRHNDTELHLAAQRGDLAAVKQILSDIDSQITGTIT